MYKMELDNKKKYNMILCLKIKNVPDDLIIILFDKWKIGNYFFVCDNIYCSNFMLAEEKNFIVKKDKIYSICSANCDIHFNIQYILENDIHYEEKTFLDSCIYEFITSLKENEKKYIYNLYPMYFDDLHILYFDD